MKKRLSFLCLTILVILVIVAACKPELPEETELPMKTDLPSETELPQVTQVPQATQQPTETEIPDETELPFETIERGNWAGYGDLEQDSILETRLVLVTSQEEIARLGGLVSLDALDQLAELDFERSFAIALFRGR
jgi:hypothetical protein